MSVCFGLICRSSSLTALFCLATGPDLLESSKKFFLNKSFKYMLDFLFLIWYRIWCFWFCYFMITQIADKIRIIIKRFFYLNFFNQKQVVNAYSKLVKMWKKNRQVSSNWLEHTYHKPSWKYYSLMSQDRSEFDESFDPITHKRLGTLQKLLKSRSSSDVIHFQNLVEVVGLRQGKLSVSSKIWPGLFTWSSQLEIS